MTPASSTPSVSPATGRAAVLGSPIAHSLSPVLHTAGYAAAGLGEWDYTRIECTAAELPRVVGEAGPEFRGFSVTMPCKFAALEFADEVTARARAIGSANTLVRTGDGWRADNTDCEGLQAALAELTRGEPVRRAVVVGAGGTARPALWALRELGVEQVTVVNRSDRSAELAPLTEGMGVRFADYSADLAALTTEADAVISTVPSACLLYTSDAADE